ncbi:2-amino-4-hydroxy-6-hydroxymethyldihydropteridine diphosphokinase [Neolewinella aurantiaca]|uniref:2-amino-4-hydroxy-6- hydroxymethyldihydropteridine diphosphokinase n=1 Tax=Neolewinella aurantiaca TaxID=2602767 RepID=UPI00164F10F0|nr:2-amino-4-hydroxy-6-hydroxymethyldihydropteridine diphosphokinase [Neolewinella aurantiaca]
MTVTLALGSNLGDRHATLITARRLIRRRIGLVIYESELLETKAWGVEDQPDFLNQVITVRYNPGSAAGAMQASLKTRLLHLLDLTQGIEAALGRERKAHWGPRTCDIDIIFVDNIRFESERLSLPHPWWAERHFVRNLLSE